VAPVAAVPAAMSFVESPPPVAAYGNAPVAPVELASIGAEAAVEPFASPEAADEPGALTAEAVQRAAMHRRMAASFGDVVGLMMQAPQFKHMTLTDLEWLVLPGLATGQFLMMEALDRATGATGPLAAALWARVSEDVEARIVDGAANGRPFRLAPADWVSGDRHWLVAAVGGEQAVAALMAQLRAGPFAELPLAVGVGQAQDGQVQVVGLGD
jgi:hemolysin-activating ACP:hemolysin acyltransferase